MYPQRYDYTNFLSLVELIRKRSEYQHTPRGMIIPNFVTSRTNQRFVQPRDSNRVEGLPRALARDNVTNSKRITHVFSTVMHLQ